MEKLNKIEQATKIVLSIAVVGTVCKIALERHESDKRFRKKMSDILTDFGAFKLDKEKNGDFFLELLKITKRH
ncbi:TPA: hypothetical protein U1235_001901 [Streptococcus suis]|nr:hypothetical protein [Streptococcus suis]HEM5200010.1 hypothetical protein [Streptococcus suis]